MATGTSGAAHFNGFPQGAACGDDARRATNYPLLPIMSRVTGHVANGIASAPITVDVQ